MPDKHEIKKVFISYSHKDETWKDRLVTQLSVLINDGFFEVWDDRRIEGGGNWLFDIEQAIQACDVALLLVSANFLTSKFILTEEIPKLLTRRVKEGIRVIPVILTPCSWQKITWLEGIQCRPTDGVPLSSYKRKNDAETAMAELAQEVLKLASVCHITEMNKVSLLDECPEIGCNFTRQYPNFEISLQLFQRHIFDEKILPEIIQRLIIEFSWVEERACMAQFVINKIVAHAFEHGCAGNGERTVSIYLGIEADRLLIIKVKSPEPVFNLHDVLSKKHQNTEGERGYRLSYVIDFTDELVSSSDDRIIQATFGRTISIGKPVWSCFDEVSIIDIGTKCVAVTAF